MRALTIEIDDATVAALDRIAEEAKRPREMLLREVLQDYVSARQTGPESASRPGGRAADPYLVYLDGFLSEWDSPGDDEAFRDL